MVCPISMNKSKQFLHLYALSISSKYVSPPLECNSSFQIELVPNPIVYFTFLSVIIFGSIQNKTTTLTTAN